LECLIVDPAVADAEKFAAIVRKQQDGVMSGRLADPFLAFPAEQIVDSLSLIDAPHLEHRRAGSPCSLAAPTLYRVSSNETARAISTGRICHSAIRPPSSPSSLHRHPETTAEGSRAARQCASGRPRSFLRQDDDGRQVNSMTLPARRASSGASAARIEHGQPDRNRSRLRRRDTVSSRRHRGATFATGSETPCFDSSRVDRRLAMTDA
jgi:hypothetical protein